MVCQAPVVMDFVVGTTLTEDHRPLSLLCQGLRRKYIRASDRAASGLPGYQRLQDSGTMPTAYHSVTQILYEKDGAVYTALGHCLHQQLCHAIVQCTGCTTCPDQWPCLHYMVTYAPKPDKVGNC